MKKIGYIFAVILMSYFILVADDGKDDVVFTGENLRYEAGTITDGKFLIDESYEKSGITAHTPPLLLNKGGYSVQIAYRSQNDGNTAHLNHNGIDLKVIPLKADENIQTAEFELPKGSQELWIKFDYCGKGELEIQSITYSCDTSFYTDIYLVLTVFILGCSLIYLLMQKDWTEESKKKKLLIGIVLFGSAIYATYPFFTNTLLHADDLSYHLLRIEGIKDALLEGQFPVVILPEALEGNGYLNSMYPSLFLYIPALLRMMGISLVTSYKSYVFLLNAATAWIMYYSVKSISNNRKAALLAAVLYTLCPYRFTNIYARGAVGEATAMTFFPLLFAGLYHTLAGKKEKWYLLAISIIGLLHSHILSVLLAGLICVIFGICYIVPVWKEKRYLEIIKAAFWVGVLDLWWLIPFLMYYLRGSLWMSSLEWSTFEEYAVNIFTLFQTMNLSDYRNYSLGLALILCVGIAIVYLIADKIKSKEDCFLLKMLLIGIFCTYLVTNYFSGWSLMGSEIVKSLLYKIQFPWRMLAISSCIFAMTGSIWIFGSGILKDYRKVICYLLVGLTLLSTLKTIDVPVYENQDDVIAQGHIQKVIGVPYTRGRNLCYPYDYRLGGSNNDSIVSEPVLSDETKIEIWDYQKDGTKAFYRYSTSSQGQYIEVPFLAYKGYVARDENGEKIKIHKESDSCNRIRIELIGDGEEHSVSISFEGYWFMTLANFISLAALVTLVAWYIIKKSKRRLV
ncbi:MAG: 6-pyruvoyl-tetrahydropterin synthase-related protein [Lachnospiraceae bacterium]|nr:6-pyruvoyl-tetrahydropterin synthase-related protein [Lachnospiraceae bacterium]